LPRAKAAKARREITVPEVQSPGRTIGAVVAGARNHLNLLFNAPRLVAA
jgi:hypothetical protein